MVKPGKYLLIAVFLVVLVTVGGGVSASPHKPHPKDKCPVCGMFVAKYPDWVASITFSDDSRFFFDGVKDMCKFMFDMEKYAPGKTMEDISEIYVTEYYDMKIMNARKALYVMGSDVFGPMGKELIPFANEEDAEQFKKDHQGQVILRFEQITPAIIKRLD